MQTYSTKTRVVAHIPAIWIRTAQSIGSWGYTGDLQRGPCTTASAQEKEEEKGEVGSLDTPTTQCSEPVSPPVEEDRSGNAVTMTPRPARHSTEIRRRDIFSRRVNWTEQS